MLNWKGRNRQGDGNWKAFGEPTMEGKHHGSLQHPTAKSRDRSKETWQAAGGSVGLQHCMAQVVRKP